MKVITIDEAHHAAASSYRHMLSRFTSIKNPHTSRGSEDEVFNLAVAPPPEHSVPIIGFSATSSRHDGLALGSGFNRIVYHRNIWT